MNDNSARTQVAAELACVITRNFEAIPAVEVGRLTVELLHLARRATGRNAMLREGRTDGEGYREMQEKDERKTHLLLERYGMSGVTFSFIPSTNGRAMKLRFPKGDHNVFDNSGAWII